MEFDILANGVYIGLRGYITHLVFPLTTCIYILIDINLKLINFMFSKHRIRFWWMIAFILSTSLCVISISSIWRKWNETPVTISFSEHNIPISSIPFPTVTICPETKAQKSKLDLFNAYHMMKTKKSNLSDIEYVHLRTFL